MPDDNHTTKTVYHCELDGRGGVVSRREPTRAPLPPGGFKTNEDEARWLEQTIVLRTREGLASLGFNIEPTPNGLYDLLLLSLNAASRRGRTHD